MALLENIPQTLYKYRVWDELYKEVQYQKRILTENEIYLASPDQFNDPFDTALLYQYKDEDLTPDNIFKKLMEVGKNKWPELSEIELHEKCFKQQYSGHFENGNYWKSEYVKFKSDNNKSFGILSLTSKRDNLLMWSHYANSHQGFCVGLDQTAICNLINGTIGTMIYQNEFPKVGLFDDKVGQLVRILLTKSIEWQYEDECRIIKLHSARKIYKFPDSALLEVILGYNMESALKQTIIELTKTKFPRAKIFESVMSNSKFQLDLIPIF